MNDYICPKCGGHLSIDDEIIFLTKNGRGESAIVLLNAEPGNYNFRKNDNVNFAPGDHVNFICPICYENLNAEEYDKNLAKVIKVDENGRQKNIIFSKIVGEKCTYIIDDRNDVTALGEHGDTYKDKF